AHRAVALTPVVLVATDLLALGDRDARALKIEARRELLSALLPANGFLRTASPLDGDLERILSTCATLEITGVVAKKKGSPYDRQKGGWVHVASGAAPRSRTAI